MASCSGPILASKIAASASCLLSSSRRSVLAGFLSSRGSVGRLSKATRTLFTHADGPSPVPLGMREAKVSDSLEHLFLPCLGSRKATRRVHVPQRRRIVCGTRHLADLPGTMKRLLNEIPERIEVLPRYWPCS